MRICAIFGFFLLFPVTIMRAQDVTFAGAGCNGGAVSGSWVVPCGVTSITIDVYGAGGGAGGGGGGSNGGFFDTRGGGGAGGGGFTSITINVTPGSSFNYSAGASGCGGSNGSDASSGGAGTTGGASTFSGTDVGGAAISLMANGGGNGSGGSGTEGSPGNGGAGGTASGGTTNISGTAGSNGNGGNGGLGGAGAGPGGGAGGASTGSAGTAYGGGGAGGGNSTGGVGGAGAILITFGGSGTPPVTPTIASTPATCSSPGTSTVSNYVPGETYTFSPLGPTVGAGGAITGMVPGTNYTLVAGTGSCATPPSAPFSNAAATGSVVDPIVSTTSATCSANGSSTITTYNAANTYTFTPIGPTVGAGGVISGMNLGTNYTVTESDLTCTSAPSAPFSNQAQFAAPNINITGTLSYCAGSNTTITANGGVTYVWDDPGNSNTAAITVTQGSYAVVGTDGNGCTGTDNVIVSETAPFAINFSGALSHCLGGNTTVTASGGVSYVWTHGPVTAAVTVTQGTYTVTATDGSGCQSTDDVTITQSGTPTADFTVVDACDGVAVQFLDASTITSGAVTDWDWDFGDNTSSALQNPTHTYTGPGVYNVTLVAGSGNCTDNVTFQAVVFQVPVANFTTSNVCIGTPAVFTDNSSVSGSAIAQWAWDFDGQGNSVAQSPTFNFANAGTYPVTLGVISADLCTATYTSNVTVYPSPVASFTAPATCLGNATVFTNTSSVSSGVINQSAWDFGDGSIGVAASPTHTYVASGTYPVALAVATSNGCIGTTIQNVTVNPLPTINASHTNILCFGQTNGEATVAASGSTPPYSYQWDNAFQSNTATIQNLLAGPYTVTVTDGLGCMADTTVIVIEPLPINIQLTAGDDTCGRGNGAIRAVMIGGTAPFEFIWSAISDSSNLFSTTVPPAGLNTGLTSGDYSVIVNDAGGCSVSGSISVGAITAPVAAFGTRSEPEELTDPIVQFVNSSSNAITYEWHFGDGNVGYQEDPEHLYDTSGVFLVMLIAYNEARYGCSDTTFRYVEVAPLFTFYVPNAFTPDDDGKNDTWGPRGLNFEYESYNAQVYNRWGSLVWQTDNHLTDWDGLEQGSLKPVQQGVYVYQFTLKKFNTFEPKIITGSVTLYRHN
jgi:gliding motility-associated-like protein